MAKSKGKIRRKMEKGDSGRLEGRRRSGNKEERKERIGNSCGRDRS